MIRRPTILHLGPRTYRVVDQTYAPLDKDLRPIGLLLVAFAVALLVFLDLDLNRDPLIPLAIVTIGAVGIVIIARAPLWPTKNLLLDLDLSRGIFEVPVASHNGSGEALHEWSVDDVDELLFALRETPIDPKKPESVKIDAFALYIRTFDGDVIPVVDASLDHDRTFRVARFLGDAFDVGIKQVGKGWRT